MAYVSKCPSLAAGGRLVKKGDREHGRTSRPKASTKPSVSTSTSTASEESKVSTKWYIDNMGLDDYNTRGLGGGGQIPIRNMRQKVRPAKGRHYRTRQAHPSLLRVTRTKG